MNHGGQIEPLAARPWGQTDFRLIDPDGYYVQVTSFTGVIQERN